MESWQRRNALLLFYVLALAALRIFRRGILLALTLLGLWCRRSPRQCRHRRRHSPRDSRHHRRLRCHHCHSRCLRRHIRHCCRRTRTRGCWQAIEPLVVPVPDSLGDFLPDQTEDQSTLLVRSHDVQARDSLLSADHTQAPRPRGKVHHSGNGRDCVQHHPVNLRAPAESAGKTMDSNLGQRQIQQLLSKCTRGTVSVSSRCSAGATCWGRNYCCLSRPTMLSPAPGRRRQSSHPLHTPMG